MVDTIPIVCMYSYFSGSFGILCLSAFHMRSILRRTCKIPFFSTCYHPTFKMDCAMCGTYPMTAADPYVFWVDMFSSMHDVVLSRKSEA